MHPTDSDQATRPRRKVPFIAIAPLALMLGWHISKHDLLPIPDFGTDEISLGEVVTGKTWEQKKQDGTFGPFDSAMWRESESDPIKVNLPATTSALNF